MSSILGDLWVEVEGKEANLSGVCTILLPGGVNGGKLDISAQGLAE